MKQQQQWLGLSLLGLLSVSQAAVLDRSDSNAAARQPAVRRRGLMRDIIQVITQGGLPDPVTVLETTTMMATVTVPAAVGDLSAAAINDTAPAAVALGAAAPAPLTVTQTVMMMQSCPAVAAAPAVAAPIDTGAALAAASTAAPVVAGAADAAAGGAIGPHGGVGVQIVSLAPQAPGPSRPPSVANTAASAILPPGSAIVEGSVAASLLPLPAATAAPVNVGAGTLAPLSTLDTLSSLAPLSSAVGSLAPLPTLDTLSSLAPLNTLAPLPGAADTLAPLPGAAAPTGAVAPPPPGVGDGGFGGVAGVIPASAALPVDTSALAALPTAGAATGNFGEVPAAAPPAAAITGAPVAVNAAPLDINIDGLSLNSVLNLGNLVQQTISLQTPSAAASPIPEFRRWMD